MPISVVAALVSGKGVGVVSGAVDDGATTEDEASTVDDSAGPEVAVGCSLVAGAVDALEPVNVTPALVLVTSSDVGEGGVVEDSTLDVKLPPGPGIMIPPVLLEGEVEETLGLVLSSLGVVVGSTILDGSPAPVD